MKLRTFYWWERDIISLLQQSQMAEFVFPCRIKGRPIYRTRRVGAL